MKKVYPEEAVINTTNAVSRTFCDPMGCSPPGSSVHGIFKARILEWGVIPFPGDLPDPGIEPGSPALLADSLPFESPGKLWKWHIPQILQNLEKNNTVFLLN